jgi:ketosteroid isomerase-like protein
VGVAVAVVLLSQTAWAQETEQDQFTTDLKALFDQHNKAFSAQDVDAVMTLYSAEPKTILMGTGEGELYIGQEGIRGAYNSFCAGFEKGTLQISYSGLTAACKGDTGFFMAMTRAEARNQAGETHEFGINWSGVVMREGDAWKLRAVHFSQQAIPQ